MIRFRSRSPVITKPCEEELRRMGFGNSGRCRSRRGGRQSVLQDLRDALDVSLPGAEAVPPCRRALSRFASAILRSISSGPGVELAALFSPSSISAGGM